MKEVKLFDPENPLRDAECLGEIWFLNKKFWKISLILGYEFSNNIVSTTRTGFSICNLGDNDKSELNKIVNFLGKNKLKYKVEFSENHRNTNIKISQSKSNIEKMNAMYRSFYIQINNQKKH